MIHLVATPHRCRKARTRSGLLAAIAILFAVSVSAARAQAVYTADRIDGISVFGAFSYLNTDYGVNDYGYTVGGDLTHSLSHIRFITPSLEIRYTGSTGPAITEDAFLGGLKIEKGFRHFSPYFNVMIGYGVINYVQAKSNDNSIAYDVGVGLDYNITHQFAIKVDEQEQFWKLGQATSELTPQSISFGIVYRVPTSFGHKQ